MTAPMAGDIPEDRAGTEPVESPDCLREADLDMALRRLRQERDAARALLVELWASKTWRMTRPLRALVGLLGYRPKAVKRPWPSPNSGPVPSEPGVVPAPQITSSQIDAIAPTASDGGDVLDAAGLLGGASSHAMSAIEAMVSDASNEHPWLPDDLETSAADVPAPEPLPVGTTGETSATPALTVESTLPSTTDGRFDLLCFANIDWAARYQRPQQLMAQFASHGHRVFYIIPSRLPPAGEPYSIVAVAPGVFEVALRCDRQPDCYRTIADPGTVAAYGDAIAAMARDLRIGTAVSVVHLSFWSPLARTLREQRGWRIHYDCMDEWVGFPGIGQSLLDEEERLVAEADLVTVTAAALLRKWSPVNPNCLLVRNGVDFEFFARRCVPNDLLQVEGPVIGFYGALAEWIDFELLSELARRRPDWTLVLVGDVFVPDLAGLDALPNVILTGRGPYEQMPQFLYRFDVCLIPFVQSAVTHAVDPVKFYEYLSAGKPIVSAPLAELAIYSEHLRFASDADGFVTQIEAALAETDVEAIRRRVAVARANDWQHRFATTREAILALHPPVSIIVISYNGVALTRACVDSLFRNTTYPNYELIIVDNGSRDGSANYLRYLLRSRDTVQVILNSGNRGFAAANNQGLALAKGDVVVLLNNDTVLTRGWLEPLLRHLEDPTVGMVGPVTNAVGNEAKVEVDYSCIEDLPAFAARHVAAHAGRSFDISMLAMFCVALRRATAQRIGPLDEAFGIGLFEDDDYSRRVQQAGLRTVCVEDAYVHHHGQASFKTLIRSGEYQRLWDRNQAYFEQKWGRWTPHRTRVATPLEPTEAQRVAERWSENVSGSDAFSPEVYWLAVPAVQARHQRKGCASHDYADWVQYCLGEFLRDRLPVARMLSLGCGSGTLERRLLGLGAFQSCDAFDIAPGAIAIARDEAEKLGAANIRYREVDLETEDLPAAHYEAVWFNGSLHHIRQLEHVCGQVARSLVPGGWLFFNEYVGADRFAFDTVQRDAIRAAFESIPERYRLSFVQGSRGQVQRIVSLPDPSDVQRVDPSEAVRSQDILRVVSQHFEVRACNACGGSLLQFLLHGIAGNFRQDDPESMRVLEALFRREDELIAAGVLASDFVVVAAQARGMP